MDFDFETGEIVLVDTFDSYVYCKFIEYENKGHNTIYYSEDGINYYNEIIKSNKKILVNFNTFIFHYFLTA